MNPKIASTKSWTLLNSLIIVALGLMLCAGALPAAAQQNQPDQPGEVQGAAVPQDSQPQGQPDSPAQQPPDAVGGAVRAETHRLAEIGERLPSI